MSFKVFVTGESVGEGVEWRGEDILRACDMT